MLYIFLCFIRFHSLRASQKSTELMCGPFSEIIMRSFKVLFDIEVLNLLKIIFWVENPSHKAHWKLVSRSPISAAWQDLEWSHYNFWKLTQHMKTKKSRCSSQLLTSYIAYSLTHNLLCPCQICQGWNSIHPWLRATTRAGYVR